MISFEIKNRPTDILLAWLSARGKVSLSTLDRASRAIVEKFDERVADDRSPTHRYVAPLRRIGHVEEIAGGLAVLPTTLCWTSKHDRGVFIGARDESWRDELRRRLGPSFFTSQPDAPWPATWGVAEDRKKADTVVSELGIAAVDEPGMRLLASLPTLEEAIAAWPEAGRPSALSWEVATDPGRRLWKPWGGVFDLDGLFRRTDRQPRTWMIARGGAWRLINSPERRAVAWWSELVRLDRPRIGFDRVTGRLLLPASPLPLPVMVERPLIWASGEPPQGDSRRGLIYELVVHERAQQVARILGMELEYSS
jgi:hypothetical protein